MKDPYTVLGVSPNVEDAELKRAYHELAKKYHPDSFSDPAEREKAAEKMKEINEAYDTVKKWRAEGKVGGGSSVYYQVRTLLNEKRIREADSLLESIPYNERGAEWCYLKGAVFAALGRYFDAIRLLESAVRSDPDNAEYRAALESLKNVGGQAGGYRTTYAQPRSHGSNCDICTSLLCADCCCECMGGDLIRCC